MAQWSRTVHAGFAYVLYVILRVVCVVYLYFFCGFHVKSVRISGKDHNFLTFLMYDQFSSVQSAQST